MPRPAKTLQIVSVSAPSKRATSASRIPLRASRNDGSAGVSVIPLVTSASALADPKALRRSHSVCDQISPSACTSGDPEIRPKSPYVYPPVPTPARPGHANGAPPAGQSIGSVRSRPDPPLKSKYAPIDTSPANDVSSDGNSSTM